MHRLRIFARVYENSRHAVSWAWFVVLLCTTAFRVVADPTGHLTLELWDGIRGTGVSSLTGHADYPDNPTRTVDTTIAEYWAEGSYGLRLRGYLYPPRTGNYTFFMTSDDNGELWLSTDDTPGNKRKIAEETEHSGLDNWPETPDESVSVPQMLRRGKRYYVEFLSKGGPASNSCQLGWQGPGIEGDEERPIPGYRFAPVGSKWEDYSQWGSTRRVYLNTSSSGANVGADVADFPVLIRLRPDNFNGFADTRPGGADIRFSDADGRHLAYEIEHWGDGDSDADTADIWVLVDTVRGNTADQYINMHYGNAEAADHSLPGAVFAQSNGFAGVYHLSTDTTLYDATGYGNDGTPLGAGGAVSGGLAGRARSFDGSTDALVDCGAGESFQIQDDLTISGWYYLDSLSAMEAEAPYLWCRRYTNWNAAYGVKVTPDSQEIVFDLKTKGTVEKTQSASRNVVAGQWAFVAASFDRNAAIPQTRLWQGARSSGFRMLADVVQRWPGDIDVGGQSKEFYIGGNTNKQRQWVGRLDEVRVTHGVRSAHWLHLAYENQKPAQTLVELEAVEDYSLWRHSARLYINTTSTGANIAGDIHDFPLLIRLDSNNFDGFSSTEPGGADIRFSTADRRPLPYEIEQWVDGANNNDRAAIWVRVDTIHGYDDQQYILMYYGRGGVESRSNGAAVFGTEKGFGGVWHLSESPADDSLGHYDATRNQNHGKPVSFNESGSSGTTDTIGVAGGADYLDGTRDAVRIANSHTLNMAGPMTLSAWVYVTHAGEHIGTKVINKFATGIPSQYSLEFSSALRPGIRWRNSDATEFSAGTDSAMTLGAWHLLHGVYGGNALRVYLDGAEHVGAAHTVSGHGMVAPTGGEVFLGKRESGAQELHGFLDECRIENRARSADWIRLCYQNQKSNQTVVSFAGPEDYTQWSHSRKFYLNTTAAGAGVLGDVHEFPVLIRLSASNFDGFDQTQANGADIRFAKPGPAGEADGTHLPYEIERWDRSAKAGELWVLVDTVYGNDDAQYITMYYGNSSATPASSPEAVFNPNNGFVGVWHLAEDGGNGEGAYKDATSLNNDGTGANLTSNADVAAVVGRGTRFEKNSNQNIIIANESNFDFTTRLSLSCWFKTQGEWSGTDQALFGKNGSWEIKRRGELDTLAFWARMSGPYDLNVKGDVDDNEWHHFYGIQDDNASRGEKRRVYLEGILNNAQDNSGGFNDNDNAVTLGSDGPARYYDGVLDEVRVENTVRSDDWIRLCYQNQRKNQTLVTSTGPENYGLWAYSKRVYLNTTIAGANVATDVADFPVLIRLNPGNFPGFAYTQPGGADIRFSIPDPAGGTDGTHLPYEIERWVDGPNNNDTAEIWVRVDTIYGNSRDQYIMMYWGRPDAVSRSDGRAVFGTGNAFAAVWHFADTSTLSGSTPAGLDLVDTGTAPGSGIAGRGRAFDQEGGYLTCPHSTQLDFQESPARMTFSAWVRPGATSSRQAVFSKGLGQYDYWFGLKGMSAHARLRDSEESSERSLDAGRWHLVSWTWDQQRLWMYIDGHRDSSWLSHSATLTRDGENLRIGAKHSLDGDWYLGALDELRVSRGVRSRAWMRLCYENQKAAQTLVDMSGPEDFAQWGNARRLYLNTTATGANVSDNVLGFPVLVRLNPGNFEDFASTKAGGADIRFAGPTANGGLSALPYEIERWVDNPGDVDTAEIWVRVDTIYGGNDSQYVKLYWDNPDAIDRSNGNAVFDRGNGFGGVWHLDETAGGTGTPALYRDATGNAYHGDDSTAATGKDGAVGLGQRLGGDMGGHISVPDFPDDHLSELTVSLWLRAESSNSYSPVIDKKSDNRVTKGFTIRTLEDSLSFAVGDGTNRHRMNIGPSTDSQWVHVAGVWDANAMRVYRNGVETGSTSRVGWIAGAKSTLTFGRRSNMGTNGLPGYYDEIRVEHAGRTADWVKLCYMNQRRDGKLISMGVSLCDPASIASHPTDTTVDQGAGVSFRIAAGGTGRRYQWQRSTGDTWAADSAASNANVYSFTASSADNGARYRCIVTAQCGVPDTSNAATLTVNDTTAPTVRTALLLSASPTTVDVRWSTPESDAPDADSVWILHNTTVYPRVADTATGTNRKGFAVRHEQGERAVLLRNLEPSTRYFFTMVVSDSSGNRRRADTASVLIPAAGTVYNPLVLRVRYVDTTRVAIALHHYAGLPSMPSAPWTDTVGIWYHADYFPLIPDTSAQQLVKLPLGPILRSGTEGYHDTISIDPFPATADSYYCFAASVLWHAPDSVPPFTVGSRDSVLMIDLTAPGNPCTVTGEYPGADSSSARITVGGIDSIVPGSVSALIVRCGFTADLSGPFLDTAMSISRVLAEAPDGELTLSVTNPLFTGQKLTVYCAAILQGRNGVFSGAVEDSFAVGRAAAANPVEQIIAEALTPARIAIKWNAVSVGEAIRILYDTDTIPLGNPEPEDLLGTSLHSAQTTVDTLLLPHGDTRYFFAAQVRIGGLWTAVTERSRTSAATPELDSLNTVTNSISLDTLWFDSLTNRIGVVWSEDTTVDSLVHGYTLGLGSALIRDSLIRVLVPADTTWIPLGGDIVFDTTYVVSMWLRRENGPWALPTDESRDTVRTSRPFRQAISYFPDSSDIPIFNGEIALRPGPFWPPRAIYHDTAQAFVPDSALPGFVPVSTGFSFRVASYSPPLMAGFRYSGLPQGRGPNDIRVYRGTEQGTWLVLDSVIVDTAAEMVWTTLRHAGLPLIAMLDTLRPDVAALSEIDSSIAPLRAVTDTFDVGDNVANLRTRLSYAKGEDILRVRHTQHLSTSRETLYTDVPAAFVTFDNGVRILLEVYDGVHTDTLNISRQVRHDQVKELSTIRRQWVPLRVTADVDDKGLAGVLQRTFLSPDAPWVYDSTMFRVFRWFRQGPNAGKGAGTWVEYRDSLAEHFSLVPGRVMWLKGGQEREMAFGSGASVSLRDTVELTVPPRQWLDFALPWRFAMYVGDIVDATRDTTGQLQLYRWRSHGGQYRTEPFFTPNIPLPEYRNRSAVLEHGPSVAYCAYNFDSSAIVLRIPPVPHAMSAVSASQAKPRASRGWIYRLDARTAGGVNPGPVLCGYVPNPGEQTWLPVSPSLADMSIQIYDRVKNRTYGHMLTHRLQHGGFSMELLFHNSARRQRTLHCRFQSLGDQPSAGIQAVVVDPEDKSAVKRATEPFTVDVGEREMAYRWLVVGTEDYRRGFVRDLSAWRFGMLSVIPNPIRATARIAFSVPYTGIHRVTCTLHDTQGRQIWRHTVTRPKAGMNAVRWDGTMPGGGLTAAGTYVLRVNAYGRHDKPVQALQQRVMFVR